MSITVQDFPFICRFCLANKDLKIISDPNMHFLKRITEIEILENDPLPENICKSCLNHIENIYKFIDICKETDTFLKKIQLNVKKEIEHDDSDTNCDFPEPDPEVKPESPDLSETENTTRTFVAANIKNELKANLESHLKCLKCSENLNVSLSEHYKLNPKCKPDRNECPVCRQKFLQKKKLTLHLRTHKDSKPYECPQCSEKFSHAEKLRKHAFKHKDLKPFVCEICEKGFLRKRSLDEHLNYHTGETPFICSYCGKGFKRQRDHAAHVFHTHSENVETIPKLKRKYTEKRVHLRLECKACGKILASRSGFDNHRLIHAGIKRFLCNICGKKFITNPTLQSHIRTHTGEKPFACKECGKSFRQRTALHVHIATHANYDKSLTCPKCNKVYHTKKSLENHIATHDKEKPAEPLGWKPHKCNFCEKCFKSPSHLTVHVRTHSGEKPYVCNVCGKQMAQPQTLKVHMRQHTGETPYVCSVCDKGFHDSSNLRRHFNRNHSGHKDKLENNKA